MNREISLKKAALINASGKYAKIFLQLIVNAILARLLAPEDHGVVAVITVFSTFFTTLSDMGFGAAVVQNKELTDRDVNNIFSLTIYISVVLAMVFFGFSFAIAWFYNDSVYIPLGAILSISLFFNAMNMVPNGMMNREKKFVAIAIRTVVAYLISSVIAIVLAAAGWRYYALVVQTVISSFLIFLMNYTETKPQFIVKCGFASARKVASYSGFQFAFNLVNYFSRNLDNLLTGKFLGNLALGYYYKSYNLMLYPVNNLTGVISPVLHPILSDYQNQKSIIYQKYMKIVKLLTLIGLYVTPICYLASNEIISILYGKQWQESVICFKYLSLAILPQIIGASAGAIYQAIGQTKLLFKNGVINTSITISAILIGVLVGKNIEVLSLCVSVAYIIHFIIVYYMLITLGFKYKISRFYYELRKEILILLIMILVTCFYPFRISQVFLSGVVKMIYLGVVYIIALIVTGEIHIFLELINRRCKTKL